MMRVSASILFILFLLTVSCNLREDDSGFICEPSKNLFEGHWEWVETKGIGFDGLPFTRNPVSEGYTWKFTFYDPHCFNGKLQTYKDDIAEIFYIYQYTTSSNPSQQQIELDRMGNNIPEIFYWQITRVENTKHLFLSDPNYIPFEDPCCSTNLEHHFVLTSQNAGRCNLIPDPGPCDADISKYYFNNVTGKCEVFSWGGCGGIVPFQTLNECSECLKGI